MRVTARNIRVVKNRTLLSAYRDVDYPPEMPFYLYGRQDEVFVDHMLLRAPNVQITAINPISLSGITLTDEQLEKGVLAFIDVHERAGQPFSQHDFTHMFGSERKFAVRIYDDQHPADARGPGLADVPQSLQIGSGSLTFTKWPWVWEGINQHRDPPSVDGDMAPKSLQDLLNEIPVILPQPHSATQTANLHMYSLKPALAPGSTVPDAKSAKTVNAWIDLMSESLPSFRK